MVTGAYALNKYFKTFTTLYQFAATLIISLSCICFAYKIITTRQQ